MNYSLLSKICQKPSNLPSLLCAIAMTLAKLFRHARYISVAICGEQGVMQTLVKLSGSRDQHVRRAALAALGELLFYVTTEDEMTMMFHSGLFQGLLCLYCYGL